MSALFIHGQAGPAHAGDGGSTDTVLLLLVDVVNVTAPSTAQPGSQISCSTAGTGKQ